MGKTSAAVKNRYIAKAYDRINLMVPKGDKERIKAFAEANGETVNGFIKRVIAEAMGTSGASDPRGGIEGETPSGVSPVTTREK